MARFLKQSFAQTCLKEKDNGKLQKFNYSRSLITNRGTVKRGEIHSARAMKENTLTWRAASLLIMSILCHNLFTYKHSNCTIMNYFLELFVKNLRDRIIGRIAKNYYAPLGRKNINLLCLPGGILFGSCTGTTTLSTNHYHHCHG